MPDIITALAFDFGLNKIGVAVGETLTKTAKPLAILKANSGEPNHTEVEQLIKSWRPSIIVVGLPLNSDGSHQEMTRLAENFAGILDQKYSAKYNLKITTIDESFSSLEAQKIFKTLRQNKLIKQGQKIDDIAACVILERWLTQNP